MLNELLNKLYSLKVIDTSVEAKEGEVFISSEFEELIAQVIEAKNIIKVLEDSINEILIKEFDQYPNLKSFEGDRAKITISKPVTKKLVLDVKKTFTEKYGKEVSGKEWDFIEKFIEFKLDTKALNQYIKDTTVKIDGKKHYTLPEGIEEVEGNPKLIKKLI